MLSAKKIFNTYIPAIGWFFLVLYFICMPSSSIPTPDNWMKAIYLDKWVHAVLFGVLVFLFCYPVLKEPITQKQKVHYAIKILLAAIVWGLATEFIQKHFVPGRFFDWFDWVADSFGAICGFFIFKKRNIQG